MNRHAFAVVDHLTLLGLVGSFYLCGVPGGIAFPALILLAIYRLALNLLRVGRTE